MINEAFVLKSSWINKIHPSLRVTTAIFYTTLVAVSSEIRTLVVALIYSILIVLSVNLKIKLVVKRLMVVLGFLLLIWIMLPLSFRFEAINDEKLLKTANLMALQITLKTFTISLSFMTLVSTMNLDTLGYSLSNIYVPKKMIHLFLVTYRYIFLIEQEYRKLMCAIKIRNFSPRTNIHTYRTYSYLVGMLFVRSHERAKRVYNAMICRNFSGDFVTVRHYTVNLQSIIFALCSIAVLVSLLFFEINR